MSEVNRIVSRKTPWAWGACAWAVTFGVLHVYWALGGAAGLAESAGSHLAATRPVWFVLGGLWGVAAVCFTGAALVWVLASGVTGGRGVPWLVRVAGAVLVARALAVEVLIATDGSALATSVSPAERHWTLWLWNPWFMLGGALFAAASFATRGCVPRNGLHPGGGGVQTLTCRGVQ